LARAELHLIALVVAGARTDGDARGIELQVARVVDAGARVAEHRVELDVTAERHRRVRSGQLERTLRRTAGHRVRACVGLAFLLLLRLQLEDLPAQRVDLLLQRLDSSRPRHDGASAADRECDGDERLLRSHRTIRLHRIVSGSDPARRARLAGVANARVALGGTGGYAPLSSLKGLGSEIRGRSASMIGRSAWRGDCGIFIAVSRSFACGAFAVPLPGNCNARATLNQPGR